MSAAFNLEQVREAGRRAHADGQPISACPYPLGGLLEAAWRGAWNLAEAAAIAQRDPLLTPGEVAQLFRVDPKTVTRWAKPSNGKPPKLASVRTPGGHHRYRRSEIERILRSGEPE